MRRGQVETPIVMIFAVGTGLLLLLGIGYFVLRQQGAAETQRELDSLSRIRTTLLSLEGTLNTNINVTVPDGEFTYYCNNETGMVLRYPDGKEQRLPDMLLFAPERFSGGTLNVNTAPAGKAFRIGELVLAHSPATFITRGTDLPPFPYPVSDGEAKTATNDYRGVTARGTVTMTVSPFPAQKSAGSITFTDAGGGASQSVLYPSEELISAAAITGNATLFSCGLQRYYAQLAFVTDIEHARLLSLRSKAQADGSSCQYLYEEAPFLALRSVLYKTTSPNTPPTSANQLRQVGEYTQEDVQTVAKAMADIIQMNGQLLRGDRCATVS